MLSNNELLKWNKGHIMLLTSGLSSSKVTCIKSAWFFIFLARLSVGPTMNNDFKLGLQQKGKSHPCHLSQLH